MFALSPRTTFRYVLERHRQAPEAEQPVFYLRTLGARVLLELTSLQQSNENEARVVWTTCRAGIAGFERVTMPDGKLVEVRVLKGRHLVHGVELTDPVAEDLLEAFPVDVLAELAGAIITHNALTADTAKN